MQGTLFADTSPGMIPALLHSSPSAGVAELPAAGTEFLRQCRPDVRDSGGRAAQFNKSPPDRERVARIVANMRSRLAGIFRQPVLARDSPARQCGPGLGGMKLCGRPGFVCGLCDFLLSVSLMFPRSIWPVYPQLDCARWGAPAGACRQGAPGADSCFGSRIAQAMAKWRAAGARLAHGGQPRRQSGGGFPGPREDRRECGRDRFSPSRLREGSGRIGASVRETSPRRLPEDPPIGRPKKRKPRLGAGPAPRLPGARPPEWQPRPESLPRRHFFTAILTVFGFATSFFGRTTFSTPSS
jgi:hypothetical protein